MNDKEGLDYAKQNGMQVTVPAKPEWHQQLLQIGRENVAPAWAKRAGPEGVQAFNKYLAPAVGFTIS